MTKNNSNNLGLGILSALGAGLLWGLVFVAPVLLSAYPPAILSFGRYLAFGIVVLPIAWWQRAALRKLCASDWWAALRLSIVGNIIYYLALSAAIQLSGAPLPTLIIGTLPIVIAVCSNLGARQFAWLKLLPSLLLIVAGLLCVNADQLARVTAGGASVSAQYLLGITFAWLAVAAWTWYPIKNAKWLKEHPSHASSVWATAQGVATLPLALAGFVATVGYFQWLGDPRFLAHQSLLSYAFINEWFGPHPLLFVGLMLSLGFGASWLGTLLWNIASKNTPTALTGQLIVFETLAALLYTYIVYQRLPSVLETAGIGLLIAGVVMGVRGMSAAKPSAI